MVGNLKNYTKIDILRCLFKIDKTISRSDLSIALGLGEGTIRSILNVLKENNFLDSNKNGHSLSNKGSDIMQKIKNNLKIKEMNLSSIFPNQKKIILHFKNPKNIQKAYALRDLIVKNGANGAMILRYEKPDNKLKIMDAEYEENFNELEEAFNLNKGDILIIAYSDSYRLAEHGAMAAAVEINIDLKNLMNRFK